jgi:hypothetical protein
VATSRSGRLVDPGTLTGFPDLAVVIGAPEPWYEDAACRDEPDETLFVHEASSYSAKGLTDLSSPSRLLALLICAGCPVRVQCLRSAMDPPKFTHHEDDDRTAIQRTFGVWGATTERERIALHGVPTEDAIEVLETSFPDRLAARIVAWRTAIAETRGTLRSLRLSGRDRRVAALLGDQLPEPIKYVKRPKPKPGRFRKGGPGGPGRGHLSEIGRYARDHGCSRDTAWRRTRAAS